MAWSLRDRVVAPRRIALTGLLAIVLGLTSTAARINMPHVVRVSGQLVLAGPVGYKQGPDYPGDVVELGLPDGRTARYHLNPSAFGIGPGPAPLEDATAHGRRPPAILWVDESVSPPQVVGYDVAGTTRWAYFGNPWGRVVADSLKLLWIVAFGLGLVFLPLVLRAVASLAAAARAARSGGVPAGSP